MAEAVYQSLQSISLHPTVWWYVRTAAVRTYVVVAMVVVIAVMGTTAMLAAMGPQHPTVMVSVVLLLLLLPLVVVLLLLWMTTMMPRGGLRFRYRWIPSATLALECPSFACLTPLLQQRLLLVARHPLPPLRRLPVRTENRRPSASPLPPLLLLLRRVRPRTPPRLLLPLLRIRVCIPPLLPPISATMSPPDTRRRSLRCAARGPVGPLARM